MWVRINGTIQINLESFGTLLGSGCESSRTHQHPLLSTNVIKESVKLFDGLNVRRTFVVLAVNNNLDFVLSDSIMDQNVDLASAP